jgi:hydrogenase/urease accessory protein HupE
MMTSSFYTYFLLGVQHILDWNGYDHLLFLFALCATFTLQEWKPLLILLTAFTIGHSVTLALAALDKISVPAPFIEILIPITILITSVLNLQFKRRNTDKQYWLYGLAAGFGLIHGLGFSTYFRSLLGKEESIVQPLFAFNIGIEAAQILVVVMTMVIAGFLFQVFPVRRREWTIFVSGAVFSLALKMVLERVAGFW